MKDLIIKIIKSISAIIIIVLLTLFCMWLVNCSKSTDIKQILVESSTDILPIVEDIVIKPKWPSYFDGEYRWKVEYKEHTNVHHPKGYVIITKIKKYTDTKSETWTINYNIENYIEDIHYNLKAKHNSGYEEDNVFLPSNINFRSAFRTAEAIIIAWIYSSNNPIETQDIKEAAIRMNGRKTGLMRK